MGLEMGGHVTPIDTACTDILQWSWLVSQHLFRSSIDTDIGFRVSLAENWRRRGKFEDVKFIFPNAPMIPITIVRTLPPTDNGMLI
jgi:hypothetical protein